MSYEGQYYKQGDKLCTTYPEKGEAMWSLVEDYYNSQYGFSKSAGSAVYTTDRMNGYHNAIYGKYITAAMFMSDNVFASLGARPYTYEGVRIATEMATYGLATERDVAMGLKDVNVGDFIGIGATTVQDGAIPPSVKLPVKEYREPSKDIPLAFDYGMYLAAVENKDDTIQKRDYFDKISRNFSDQIDKTLLRPIEKPQPVLNDIETSLNGLTRLVSGFNEIGRTVNGKTIDDGMVSPYGGRTTDRGDFYAERSAGESNLDANVIDLAGRTLSINDMRRLYRECSVNWADVGSPNNKMFAMSNVAIDKLGALASASNVYLNSVYVQRDFNGVKTMPGRDVGLVLKSFNNIPLILDGNINYDFDRKKVSAVRFGDIFLLDMDHIWMSILTPIQLHNVANPAITGYLQEKNVVHTRMETRIDSFIQHGRLVGIADDTL